MTELPILLPRVEDLATLPIRQLIQIKKLLEKYFASNGVNVALYKALKTKETREFKRKVKDTIKKQVLAVVQLDNVAQHFAVIKKQKKSDFFDEWTPFVDTFEGGAMTLFAFLVFSGEIGGQSALDKIKEGLTFDLVNKLIKEELGQRIGFLEKALDKTTQDWITESIEIGRRNGATALQIVKDIRGKLEKTAESRAEIITETELVTAMGIVEVEVYKRNGIRYVKWVTSEDERVCSICMGNEYAGEVKVGDEFPSGNASVPAHLLCRCLLLPVIPNDFGDIIWTGK